MCASHVVGSSLNVDPHQPIQFLQLGPHLILASTTQHSLFANGQKFREAFPKCPHRLGCNLIIAGIVQLPIPTHHGVDLIQDQIRICQYNFFVVAADHQHGHLSFGIEFPKPIWLSTGTIQGYLFQLVICSRRLEGDPSLNIHIRYDRYNDVPHKRQNKTSSRNRTASVRKGGNLFCQKCSRPVLFHHLGLFTFRLTYLLRKRTHFVGDESTGGPRG